jgi:hypothetical protein
MDVVIGESTGLCSDANRVELGILRGQLVLAKNMAYN